MKPPIRTAKLGRRKPIPRFPTTQAEYRAASARSAGSKYYIDAIVETKLGTLSVSIESGQNLVVLVDHQSLKPEHFGLQIESYILRSINGQEIKGWGDEFRANA
jgi:hypothetical protein